MLIAYWIVAGLLGLVFLAAGIMKAVRPREALIGSGLTYVEDSPLGRSRPSASSSSLTRWG